ncbi:hypothetical protein M6B38_190405 [Iris pallida]|uniref:Uncharacterized protein n=1 Tax=Iris pallida TaxID=29817 RepID=A0AAX6EG17_IRIPA|nr:hypothetical protein M6B38_190405 [Iris pallida]
MVGQPTALAAYTSDRSPFLSTYGRTPASRSPNGRYSLGSGGLSTTTSEYSLTALHPLRISLPTLCQPTSLGFRRQLW